LVSARAGAMYPAATMITPAQVRAARALLGWRQADLAKEAGASEMSIKNLERGVMDARGSTLGKIGAAFASRDIEFLDPGRASPDGGYWIRFRKR